MSQAVLRLVLRGDLMLGRGIDQVMPRHCPPELNEPHVRNTRYYVRAAEQRHGVVAPPSRARLGTQRSLGKAPQPSPGWHCDGRAGVDLVFGYSSHHPLPPELHSGRLILFGSGDLINNYEGLTPHAPWLAW